MYDEDIWEEDDGPVSGNQSAPRHRAPPQQSPIPVKRTYNENRGGSGGFQQRDNNNWRGGGGGYQSQNRFQRGGGGGGFQRGGGYQQRDNNSRGFERRENSRERPFESREFRNNAAPQYSDNDISEEFLIPSCDASVVIGRGGSTIRGIQDQFGVRVSVGKTLRCSLV